jgi:amidase
VSISCFTSATELVRALRQREISAVQLLDLFTAQYERHNPQVNAICTFSHEARKAAVHADEALARGEAVGPLHGLPVSFKDSFETKGMRTTCGYPAIRDWVPDQDATVVARIRKAGGIPFAKTNVPPLLAGFHSNNEIFGCTNNPWNLAYTAGGSSGGSAAALAAGMTPFDPGSDMLGSIRVPAHFCGVAGLKPTQNRVSIHGHYPPLPGWAMAGNLLSTRGPMARSVEDLLLTLPIMAGYDPLDPDSVPVPLEDPPAKAFSDYRVAWTDDFGGVRVTTETRLALERTAALLEKAGMRVEKTSPAELDFERIWRAAGEICTGILSWASSPEERQAWSEGLRAKAGEGPLQAGSYEGLQGNQVTWMRALETRQDLILKLRRFFESWDGWLVPTTCAPAFRSEDYLKPVEVGGAFLAPQTAMASHVAPFNLSGSPAVTFPVALSGEGLPIGLQLVGPSWGDMALLRLAHRIEGLLGPFPIAPGYLA